MHNYEFLSCIMSDFEASNYCSFASNFNSNSFQNSRTFFINHNHKNFIAILKGCSITNLNDIKKIAVKKTIPERKLSY